MPLIWTWNWFLGCIHDPHHTSTFLAFKKSCTGCPNWGEGEGETFPKTKCKLWYCSRTKETSCQEGKWCYVYMLRSALLYDGAVDRFPLWTMRGRGGRVIMPSLLWVNNTTSTHFIKNTTHLIQDIALRGGYEPRRIPPGPRYFVSALCYDTARYIPLCIVCVLQYCKEHYKRRENSLAMQRFLWKTINTRLQQVPVSAKSIL